MFKFFIIFKGACKPGLFIEQDISEFESGMQLNYYGTLYTVHVSKNMFLYPLLNLNNLFYHIGRSKTHDATRN